MTLDVAAIVEDVRANRRRRLSCPGCGEELAGHRKAAERAAQLRAPLLSAADIAGELGAQVRTRARADDVDRSSLGRAVRVVGHAEGIPATAAALHALAVEALAWRTRLVRSPRELRAEA